MSSKVFISTWTLPFDRAGRLGGDVVGDAVDALDLVDDPGRGLRQEGMLEGVVVGGHAVDRGHGAQRTDVVVGAPVAHHADGAHRQEHGEGLPDRVVEAVVADLVEIDGIGLAQDRELFAGDLAGAADGEAGPGKGWRPTKVSGRPSSRPSARTSSLKSSRSGSTSFRFIRSGRPPTLWWLLIVTEGPPVKLTLSITSG
jgi:hypothetical protein